MSSSNVVKFYEFVDFEQYAIISAETEGEAIKFYTEKVKGTRGDKRPLEITKIEAKEKLIRACEEAELEDNIFDFNVFTSRSKPYLILTDGSVKEVKKEIFDRVVEYVKLSENSYVIVTKNIDEKNIERFVTRTYKVGISTMVSMLTTTEGRLIIYRIETDRIYGAKITQDCLDGIKDYLLK